MTPSLIWDIVLVAVAIAVVAVCCKRGLLASLVSLLGTAAAVITAALLSPAAAGWVYDSFLAEKLEQSVSEGMAERLSAFAELIDRLGMEESLHSATESAVRTVSVALITVIGFLIIFLLAMLLVRLLLAATRGVNRVPLLGGLNRLFGGVLGVGEAYFLLYVIGMAVTLLVSLSKNQWGWLNTGVVEETKILSWFIQHKLPF